MRFSIIVPVYNVAEYLQACVDSLLAQRCDSYEVVL
ncbi:MAG: glycosyltransferase, partial [Oscillospiraceae bacterium]|nr:glycosyltransferase [Oscillospiraceae bacterium]